MKYFIDTNVIIDLLNDKQEAKDTLKTIIEEDGSELFINRLVLAESLRTIHYHHTKVFKKAEEQLKLFRQVDIRPEIYTKAIAFSRFCNTEKHVYIKGKCDAIDFLHFITAKYYGLEIIAYDGDFEKLEEVYTGFE